MSPSAPVPRRAAQRQPSRRCLLCHRSHDEDEVRRLSQAMLAYARLLKVDTITINREAQASPKENDAGGHLSHSNLRHSRQREF